MRTLRLIHSPGPGDDHVELAVEAAGRARRAASARVSLAVTPADQERIRWYLEDYAEGPADEVTRQIAGQAERLVTELGERLFEAIFWANRDTSALWEALRPGLAETRVEIVTGVAGATALPWELLRDPASGQALALQAAALVRAHPRAAQPPLLPSGEAGTLRVLLVISRPLAVDVGFRSVARQLTRLHGRGLERLRLDVLRPPEFARLGHVLRAARDAGVPYDVVHFDGHGVWADTTDGSWWRGFAPAAAPGAWHLVSPQRAGSHGYLLFEDPRAPGGVELAEGPAVGRLLADAAVPLLVLTACRSAHALPEGPSPGEEAADVHGQIRAFGSLAQEVMDTGVAGVVAMRYNVYVATAARFTGEVYADLLAGQSLGAAVTAGRRQLAARPAGDLGVPVQDWVVPVAWEAAPLRLTAPVTRQDRAAGGPKKPGDTLPALPGPGFVGRDETLLALDRAFDTQPVVLLHGEAGSGKTAAAAEFGRWYQRTGGIHGPVLYTSFRHDVTMAALAGQLASAFAADLTARHLAWEGLTDEQRTRVAVQIMDQLPLMWIFDDVQRVTGRRDLVAFLRSARDTRAKILLVSRSDEQAWLADLPARVALPPMTASERSLLARAAAATHNIQLTGLGPASPALIGMGGNPTVILSHIHQALEAGCTTSAGLEAFISQAGATTRQDEQPDE